ncbi:MAG: DUF47 family protein [Verrucomicrobia bacterium]|nr:DUF47 family protein [Verrucomicrobiota bacterium]
MAILTNLFGASPFGTLEAHGEKVHASVRLLRNAFQCLIEGDQDQMVEISAKVSAIELEADKLRNSLYEELTSKVLMPMRREEFFDILDSQDLMADRAEEIAATLTYRKLNVPELLRADVTAYVETVFKNCELGAGVISKLDLLVESSFEGRDALTVSRLISELAERDDALRQKAFALTRKFLSVGEEIPPVETVLWLRIISMMAELSSSASRTSYAIRKTLRIESPSKT